MGREHDDTTRAHPSGPDGDAAPRKRFGPYQILGELGRGGQGVVYRALDTRLGREVALKLLLGGRFQADAVRLRFRREAAAASMLDDPGICTVYESDVIDGVPYISMRLVRGKSVADQIRSEIGAAAGVSVDLSFVDLESSSDTAGESAAGTREGDGVRASSATGRDGVEAAVRLIAGAARALHKMHEAGLVHRDIKPGNIMVDEDGQPVILDFGLAHAADQPGLTGSGDLLGTPAYMAPEQVRGEHDRIDRRTDVWALGCTLFEILTLQRPFVGAAREALFRAICHEDLADARLKNRAVPRDLQVVLQTAMEKDPERRYRTAEDLAEDLRRVLAREPIAARPAPAWLRVRRWGQRHPALASSLCLTFVSLLAGFVSTSWLWQESESRRRDFERLEDDRIADLLVAEAETLWPLVPRRIPDLRSWIVRAQALIERTPRHRSTLERLRTTRGARAPSSRRLALEGEIVEIDRRLAILEVEEETERAELDALLERRDDLLAQAGGDAAELAVLRIDIRERRARLEDDRVALIDREMDELTQRRSETLARQSTAYEFRFASEADGFLHATLMALIGKVDALSAPQADPSRVTVAAMEARLATAQRVARSDRDSLEAWSSAVEDPGFARRYGALRLAPIAGLCPLGFDPETGLFEVAHVHSGRVPARDGATGRLELTEDSALVLVLLPGGDAVVGSPPNEAGRRGDEMLSHVRLAPFWMGKYEVTQGQWLRLMGRNPSTYGPPGEEDPIDLRHPVENIARDDAMDFARRAGLQLPTEAQWEYAARAGTTSTYCWGPDVASLQGREIVGDGETARAVGDGRAYAPWTDGTLLHVPVDKTMGNAFGLVGVHGNVSEWCRDVIGIRTVLRSGSQADEALGIPLGGQGEHVYRGGNFLVPPLHCRAAVAWVAPRGFQGGHVGVRVMRSCEP